VDVADQKPVTGGIRRWARAQFGRNTLQLRPGFYIAGRFDHLGFSEIRDRLVEKAGTPRSPRAEAAAGYSLQRNLVAKLAYQYNGEMAAGCTISGS